MAIDYTTDILPLFATDVVTEAEYLAVPASRREQDSEQAILTTVEIIRSHLANIRSDEEARIMHYCLGRMMAAVGSGGGFFDDISVYALGNDPGVVSTVAAGDTLSVTTATGTDTVTVDAALAISVEGTVGTVAADVVNGDTLTVSTVSGSDLVTLAGAPYASLAALITDINGQITTVTEVEAYDAGGTLGFRNVGGSEGVSFTLEGSILTRAGIDAGTYTARVTMAELVDTINDQLTTTTEVEAFNRGYGKLGFRNTAGNEGVAYTLGIGGGRSLLAKAGIEVGEYLSHVAKAANVARDDAISHFVRSGNPDL